MNRVLLLTIAGAMIPPFPARAQGKADFSGKEVRRLDNGGKEMQVETTAQTPNGEQTRKTVYAKS